jgi:poly(3-hydroxybutyrate) depolymerase
MRSAIALLLLVSACGSSPAPSDPPPAKRAPSDPVQVPVARWITGDVDAAAAASVQAALASGTFRLPVEGETYLGATWAGLAPDDGGAIAVPQGQAAFAVAEIDAGAFDRFFARADRVQEIGVVPGLRGAVIGLQPGDVYASGRSRVPLHTRQGKNLVVAYCGAGCALEILRTTSEIALVETDVTAPDLITGTADTQWVGLPVLTLESSALTQVSARVLESEVLRATERVHASLTPGAATQLAFELTPRTTWPAGVKTVSATLQVSSPDLAFTYEKVVEIPVVERGQLYHRTRISGVDGSVQYYGVLPPSQETAEAPGLILSLHGAAVDAIGQAASYSAKDWAYLIAPTNRRPYGFDWEEWGRVDAIEALQDALQVLPVDHGRVHLTGHSMGGHGTWHVGVHFSPRFGVIAPSAGWISFGTYGGTGTVPLPITLAREASDTLRYVENLRGHTVYVIHGTADDNVPITEAMKMLDVLAPIVEDLEHHFEPGAGHWWDSDPEAGADCVDWEPMIARMKETRFDPVRLDFDHRIVSPWVNPTHSFVTVRSELDPGDDVLLHVHPGAEGEVTVDTENARSLVLDGALLAAHGIHTVTVDGTPYQVGDVPLPIGPQDGKTETVHGPFNQVFQRPFCFVWPDDAPAYRDLAAFLVSSWNLIGNGQACGLPLSALTDAIDAERNLIWLGVPQASVRGVAAVPVSWNEAGFTVGGKDAGAGLLEFVFPAGEHLNAVITATAGDERYLRYLVPFSSRAGLPDFTVIGVSAAGLSYGALGYFTPDWSAVDARNSTL